MGSGQATPHPPNLGPADAVMSFQVQINVVLFCILGGEREDEGGWPIPRSDLIPAWFDMWPIGLHVLLSLALARSLSHSHLVLTCPHPHPHRWEMIQGVGSSTGPYWGCGATVPRTWYLTALADWQADRSLV